MPVFRVNQSGRVTDVEAPTLMEATARAVLFEGFRRDPTLVVELLSSEHQRPSTSRVEGTRAAARAQERAQRHAVNCDVPRRGAPAGTASVPQLVGAAVALSALLLAVLLGGGWFIVKRATQTGPLGDCLRIGLCVRTPLSTVEARTGVQLPQGSERLRSFASRNGRFVSALVRLPVGADLPTAPTGATSALTERASDALQSVGARDLFGWEDGAVGLFAGQDDDRVIVFLRYEEIPVSDRTTLPAAAKASW